MESKNDYEPLELRIGRALGLFRQLQVWRERGFTPQLYGGRDGWMLTLGVMGNWPMDPATQHLRFATARHPTPEDAIEAALKVIQP